MSGYYCTFLSWCSYAIVALFVPGLYEERRVYFVVVNRLNFSDFPRLNFLLRLPIKYSDLSTEGFVFICFYGQDSY